MLESTRRSRAGFTSLLLVAALMLAAAYVRLPHGDLGLFVHDQARDAHVATAIASRRSFPLLGPEVQGGPAHTWGPLYFYVLAVPFGFSHDPATAVTFLSALSLVSVFLTYRLGSAFFGARVGIIAAALFATYPLAVIETRAISNIALMPSFILVFFYSLFSLVVDRRSVMIVPLLAALAALVQLHLSTVSFFMVLLLALALFRPRVRPTHFIIALAGFLLLMLPYVLAQVLSKFQDIRALSSYAASQVRLRPPWELYELAGRVLFLSPDVTGSLEGFKHTWRFVVFMLLHRLEAYLLLLGILSLGAAIVLRRMGRGVPWPSMASCHLLALWLVVPFLMIGQKASAHLYYFTLLYPALFLAAAILLSTALQELPSVLPAQGRALLQAGVYALLALIAISQIDFQRQFWRAITKDGAILWRPGESRPVLELMPILYKTRLVESLVQDVGVGREGFFHRVHGSRFRDLLDDKGYFFQWITGRGSGGTRDSTLSPFQYALIRDEQMIDAVQGRRIVRVGPYRIVEYTPLIDYRAWACAEQAGEAYWFLPATEEGRNWLPVYLPTSGEPDPAIYGETPYHRWRTLPVYCRGKITIEDSSTSRLHLVVSLRMPATEAHDVSAFYLNGEKLDVSRSLSHSTFTTYSKDVIFDLSGGIRPGRNVVAFQISGRSPQFDLDVYEIRE